MGVGSIDDIPGDRRIEEEKKKKELRQAQHRMLQLAALRQREARKPSALERSLSSALALGRTGRTALQTTPAQLTHEDELAQRALEDAHELARQRQEAQQVSVKVKLKLRESDAKSQADAAQEHARHMLDALVPNPRSQSRQTAMADARRNQAQAQKDRAALQASQRHAAELGRTEQQQAHAHEEGARLRRLDDQLKQDADRQQESRQQAGAHMQALEESAHSQTRNRQHPDAQDQIKIAAQHETDRLREGEQDARRQRNRLDAADPAAQGNVERAGQAANKRRVREAQNPPWLKRLGEDVRQLRQSELDHLQEQIRAAQQVARQARAVARREEQGLHRSSFALEMESKEKARLHGDPLAQLPTARALQVTLNRVRAQAGENPALASLSSELNDLLQLTRRAERDWHKRHEGAAGEGIDKPKDDDASWMRRLDQAAQALSGVLGQDIQTKALQSLLGPDVARLERLVAGGAPSPKCQAQQLRVERRGLQLERWALKGHSAKLADELRDWLNRERHRVEQAESPQPPSVASVNPSQQGAADNAYLKQVQSL